MARLKNIEEAICTLSDSKRYSTLVNNTILFAISNFGSKIIRWDMHQMLWVKSRSTQ